MARKTKIVRIDGEKSRDYGKAYLITEKDVYSAEFWAMRAMGGMLNAGTNIDDFGDITNASMELLAHYWLGSFMKIEPTLLKELVDEMMECIRIIPNPDTEPGVSRELLGGDIEEMSTLIKLRTEAIGMHMDFFTKGVTQGTE